MSEKIVTFYMIYCKDPEISDTYIGSTISGIEKRMINHKSMCDSSDNRHYDINLYQFIRNNGGWENFDHKVLNQVEFYDKDIRLKQEQAYIDSYKPSLNERKAFQTPEEKKEYMKVWIEENRDKIRERERKYYEKNKEHIHEKRRENYHNGARDKILESQKTYYEANKEELKEKTKKYYEANKEKCNQRNKEYAEKNKEHLAEKASEYRKENAEELAAKTRKWYQENKEEALAYKKAYREEHKDEINAKRRERRRLKKLSENQQVKQ